MAVKTNQYGLAPDTNRGPSTIIWEAPGTPDGWIADYIQDPSLGMHFFDDFLVSGANATTGGSAAFVGTYGQWSVYIGSTANLVDGVIVGGGLQFNPASIAVSSGTSTPTTALTSQTGAFQITANSSGTSALQGRLAFEARVMLTSVAASQRDAFVGLADQTTPASGLPFTVLSGGSSNSLTSTRNLIGFYNPDQGAGQDWRFMFQLASTAPVFCSNLNSLVSKATGSAIQAGTFYKLGFVFDPVASTQTIGLATDGQTVGATAKAMLTVFVNGVKMQAFLSQAANILTASFPTGIMAPIVAFANCSSSGTGNSATNSSGQMVVDWVRVAQRGIT
jgi:hypothetical protein